MRLRLPELLADRGLTAYALSKQSQGRLSMAIVYRISQEGGAFRCLSPKQLEALCDVLQVEPGELFERDKKPRRK